MSGSLFGPTSPKGGGSGGGGSALEIDDEGVLVDAATSLINFTGAGVTASLTGPGAVAVTIPGMPPGYWAGAVPAASFALVGGVMVASVAFGTPHPSGVNYSVATDEVVVAGSGLSLDITIENQNANGFDIVLNTAGPLPNLVQVDWQVQPHGVAAGPAGLVSLPGINNTIIVDKGSNVTEDGSQQQPFHTITGALAIASSGDVILIYPGVYTETITPVNGVTLRGIDAARCILSAPLGAGDTLGTIAAGVDFTIAHMILIGQLVLNGNAAVLRLVERTVLEGNVDIAAGDFDTELIVEESDIHGDSTFDAAVTIGVDDPRVTVTAHSEVIGYESGNGGSTPAFYWSADNDNVRLSHSRIMHGTALSNPFGRSAAQTPRFRSHHCAFNSDPESGAIWVNEISPGQRFDTLDNLARY